MDVWLRNCLNHPEYKNSWAMSIARWQEFLLHFHFLTTSTDHVNVAKAKLSFLLHLCKGTLPVTTLMDLLYIYIMSDALQLNIIPALNPLQRTLEKMSAFLEHPKLRALQSEVATEVVGVANLPDVPLVVPVCCTMNGWCGVDCIYVNLQAFTELNNYPQIQQADLCTILAHESMHFYLRQLLNDFNLSTPERLVLSQHLNEDMESGHLIECKLFGGIQPNWHVAAHVLPNIQGKAKAFIQTALNRSSNLVCPTARDFAGITRKSPAMAVDLQLYPSID